MPPFLVKEPARVDGNLLLIVALIAPCALGAPNRSQFQMMLPRCSPGGLFLFCNLCWRFTRQLIPRFLVVRIVVDPVKQLLTAWLLVLGPWGFWFRPFRVERHIVESNGQWGVTPAFSLVGLHYIAPCGEWKTLTEVRSWRFLPVRHMPEPVQRESS